MMKFRELKASLVTLLETNAAGQFRVFSSQTQGKSAEEFTGTNRTIRVYFGSGDFPRSGGSQRGPMKHDLNFNMELIVVESAEVDLAVLENPASTPAEKIAALNAANTAADQADDSWDEFADLVFQIIMDARNQDLGLAQFDVRSRWLQTITKSPVEPMGEYVVLTGTMTMNCNVQEVVTGATPVPGDILSGDILIKDDNTQQTGVETDLT
jgi:hypothetical protein